MVMMKVTIVRKGMIVRMKAMMVMIRLTMIR